MSGHTKGPWRVCINNEVSGSCGNIETLTGADHYSKHGSPYVAVVDADGDVVCDNAQYYAQALDPANANLIAAAPELLEALEECLPCKHASLEELQREHELGNGYAELILRARAAIAKAKGESL